MIKLFFLLAALNTDLVTQKKPSPQKLPPSTPRIEGGIREGIVGGTVRGPGKILDFNFGGTPTSQEQAEMDLIATDLYPQLLYYFQSTATVTQQSNENNIIVINNGVKNYENPYLSGIFPKHRPWKNVEGPRPGCFMLRVSMAMNGADAPRSRNQTWDFVFGTWYYAKVVIPNKRYVVWFDYISKAPDSFQIQNEIRKIINKVISSRIATF